MQIEQKKNANYQLEQQIAINLKSSKRKEKKLQLQLFYKNRNLNRLKEEIIELKNEVLRSEDSKQEVSYRLSTNNEMESLIQQKREKESKIVDLQTKIFLKNYERIDQNPNRQTTEEVEAKKDEIMGLNEGLEKEVMNDWATVENDNAKQNCIALREQLKVVLDDISCLKKEMREDIYSESALQRMLKNLYIKNHIL